MNVQQRDPKKNIHLKILVVFSIPDRLVSI